MPIHYSHVPVDNHLMKHLCTTAKQFLLNINSHFLPSKFFLHLFQWFSEKWPKVGTYGTQFQPAINGTRHLGRTRLSVLAERVNGLPDNRIIGTRRAKLHRRERVIHHAYSWDWELTSSPHRTNWVRRLRQLDDSTEITTWRKLWYLGIRTTRCQIVSGKDW
jgi:hypothetical protein